MLSNKVGDRKVSTYITNNQLYHHGIKGQKWGVRRFQDKNGRLTAAGRKRYAEDGSARSKPVVKNASTHRSRLETEYQRKGMSEAEARAAAEKRIKIEKAIAVTAGVTLTACAAYYAKNKWIETYCDQVLKAGTTFHNLDSIANPRPGEHLYVNYRQDDVNYFRGHFAVNKMQKDGHVFNHTISATEDVKIPSLNMRKSVFKELFDNDEEFRKVFNEHSSYKLKGNMSARKAYKEMWPNFGDKDDPEFNVVKRKYFEALKQKGYAAIVDEWDTNKDVFRSNAPLILLDTSHKSLGEMTITELTNRDILLAQANSRGWKVRTNILNSVRAPHTNHFKESEKYLAKYAAKSAKNAKYIDAYLENVDKIALGGWNKDVSRMTESEYGRLAANLGKHVSKIKDKDSKEEAAMAVFKGLANSGVENLAELSAAGAVVAAPLVGLDYGASRANILLYRKQHPNSTMTDDEILVSLGLKKDKKKKKK